MSLTVRFFVACVLFLAGVQSIKAQDFNLNTWVKSQYIGANGAIFESRPVLQTELSVSRGNCWTSVWLSTTGEGWKSRGGDEIDYNGSCSWQLNDTVSVSVLVAYYDLAAPGGVSDMTVTIEHGLYYGKVSHYGTHGGLPFEGGEFLRAGRKFQLGTFQDWDFIAATEVSYDLGSFGLEEGLFGKVSFSGSRTLDKTTKMSFSVDFSDGITVSDRHGELATWIGVSRSF